MFIKGAPVPQFANTRDTSTLTSNYWPAPAPIPITTDDTDNYRCGYWSVKL